MKTVIVIPTYSDHETIGALLAALARVAPTSDVLVVDDASPDGTGRLVRADPRFGSSIFLHERDAKSGLGAAYRVGFAWALARDYQGVVQMDADLSHPPDRVPALIAALQHADVVVGSRYVRGGRVLDWTPWRRLLSRGGNVYVRRVLGLRTRDTTAGFKAFRTSALRWIAATASTSDGYCFQVENTWRAERLGLRVAEIPITLADRAAGKSKMTGDIVREALTQVLSWRAKELRDRLRYPTRSRIRPV